MDPCIRFHSEADKEFWLNRHQLQIPADKIEEAWKQLLDIADNEQAVQDFLEIFPEFLPGLFDLHNGPLHGIIISKFPFGADFKCDFAFVTRHSMAIQFTFIEIEDPKKPVFNKDGSFSQGFNHARQQIADWKIWVENNESMLMNMLGSMFEHYNAWNDHKDYRFYLVCGRRSDIESDKKRKERWSSIYATSDRKVIVCSYDRLKRFEKTNEPLTVCTYKGGVFYAKPPSENALLKT